MLKKWNGRILASMLAALVILTSVMIVPAFAADSMQVEYSVSDTDLEPGDTFTIDARFTNFSQVAADGIQGFQLEYTFSTSDLEFVEGTSNLMGNDFTAELHSQGGYVIALFFPATSAYLEPTNDTIFSLTFRVRDDAVNGDYSIQLRENSVCLGRNVSNAQDMPSIMATDTPATVSVDGGLTSRDDSSTASTGSTTSSNASGTTSNTGNTSSSPYETVEEGDVSLADGETISTASDGTRYIVDAEGNIQKEIVSNGTSHQYETVEEEDVSLADGETISTASDGTKYIVDANGNIQKEIVSDGNRAPSSSNGALIAVIIVIVIVLIAGGAYALYYYKFKKSKDPFNGQSGGSASVGNDGESGGDTPQE